MSNNQTRDDIEKGFNALAGGVREAGRKRNMDLVDKQGYVGFHNQQAANLFQNDPDYANWRMEEVDGEIRFYPPNKDLDEMVDEAVGEKETILDSYKKAAEDPSKRMRVVVNRNPNGRFRCILLTTDLHDGHQEIVRDEEVDFEGKFSHEVLPSLYNQVAGGFPTDEQEKYRDDKAMINFRGMNGNDIMIGGLDSNQLQTVKDMRDFVESNYRQK